MHVGSMLQRALSPRPALQQLNSDVGCESCCCAPWQEALPQDDDAS